MNADEETMILGNIVKTIVAQPGVKRIIIFGSRAEGLACEDSDFDIFLIIENGKDKRGTYMEIMRKLVNPDYSIDLLVCEEEEYERKLEEGWSVFQAVQAKGRLLYAA